MRPPGPLWRPGLQPTAYTTPDATITGAMALAARLQRWQHGQARWISSYSVPVCLKQNADIEPTGTVRPASLNGTCTPSWDREREGGSVCPI